MARNPATTRQPEASILRSSLARRSFPLPCLRTLGGKMVQAGALQRTLTKEEALGACRRACLRVLHAR